MNRITQLYIPQKITSAGVFLPVKTMMGVKSPYKGNNPPYIELTENCVCEIIKARM